MPYALHNRLTFAGVLGDALNPFEQFSFRLNLGPITVGGDIAQGLLEAETAYATHLAPRIGSQATLKEIKFARIGTDGLYTDDAVLREVDVPGSNNSTTVHAPQVSMVVSLNTATRGSSGRGRMYLPSPREPVGQITGTITAASAQAYATSAAEFLGALNLIGEFGPVIIASTKGFNSVVTDVRTGVVLDTMRSRRTSIGEAYGADVDVSQVAG